MMKNAGWVLGHAVHWAVIYLAFFGGSDGAMNVLKFFSWFTAVISLVLFCEAAAIEESKSPPSSSIKSNMSLFQAWVSVVLFAWFSCVFTATAVAVSAFAFSCFQEKVKLLRKKTS